MESKENTQQPTNNELIERMTSFLEFPYSLKLEQSKKYSFFEETPLEITQSKTQEQTKNVYESILDSKNQEITPIKSNTSKPSLDMNDVLMAAAPTTLQQNYDSFADIKRKEDEIQSLTTNTPETPAFSSGGNSNNSSASVVNNTTNVTNIVPDYILSLKRKSQSPPAWRDSSG